MTNSGTAIVTESAIETRGPGDVEASHRRGFPNDVEEHILSKLPLWEVARMSSTSRHFRNTFTRRLETEKKAREQFGKERIASIVALIQHCNKRETTDPAFRPSSACGWMSADGKLHEDGEDEREQGHQAICERGDIVVVFDLSSKVLILHWGRASRLAIFIGWREGVSMSLSLGGNGDLPGVALVQVLLNGVDGPTFHDGGHPVNVHVEVSPYLEGRRVSEAVLQTQIAPLMPLASHVRFRYGSGYLSFLWKSANEPGGDSIFLYLHPCYTYTKTHG